MGLCGDKEKQEDCMKILVIGSGGREHALADAFSQSTQVEHVYCAPGNAGMDNATITSIAIAETAFEQLADFAEQHQIAWTFVGPELPLSLGIVDYFQERGLKIYGPDKAAAQLESSKDFAKQLMVKYGIPTAAYQTFENLPDALAYIRNQPYPLVIKADGLAAGKGVFIVADEQEAAHVLTDILADNRFGASGAKVVIEEFLEGEEFSLLSFVSGTDVYPMVIAQDHKRAYDGDKGPNTGGMGAYSPVPHIPDSVVEEAVRTIVQPTAEAMTSENTPFNGILYAGLILTDVGPKVIEFNVRFGDPETQVVLPRLKSDLAAVINDLLNGKKPQIAWQQNGVSLGVVVAAEGYPGSYKKGMRLPDLSKVDGKIYYSGVSRIDGRLVSNGGRVFLLEVNGKTLPEVQEKVYTELSKINLEGLFFRKDIGFRGID